MKSVQKIPIGLIVLFLLASTMISPVLANSAEPPCLTVIVSAPPEDLTLSIRFGIDEDTEEYRLVKEQKAWETHFRYYYTTSRWHGQPTVDITLTARSSAKDFECALPASMVSQYYNNLITLNFQKESVLSGQTTSRVYFLVFLRVGLTLLIEGIIFFFIWLPGIKKLDRLSCC